jgi:hypothetical protein
MRLKMIVVDMELTRAQRRWAQTVGMVGLLCGVAFVADAAVPQTWMSGDTLLAEDLNANFTALDERIVVLEQQITSVPELGGDVTELQGQVAEMSERLAALESRALPLTEVDKLAAVDGDSYWTECLGQSGTFPAGACERMADYTCAAAGYVSGWFQGDIESGNIGIMCIR